MGRHTIFVTLALTFVWVILMEGFSWQNVAIGMFMSMLAMHYMGKFFGFEEIRTINFYGLAFYPIWLIGRIYGDAFFLVKLVLSNPKWGIVTHKLELENETLRVILCDSITLTPGSVYLEREEKNITLLCIGKRELKGYPSSIEGLRRIEEVLKKADKLNIGDKS